MSGDKYFIKEQTSPHYVTFTVVDWVDVFTRLRYREIITDSLNHCINKKGLVVWAWCLMSNHLHAVLQAKEGYELSAIIRDFKKHTSKTIVNTIQTEPESRREWMLHRFDLAQRQINALRIISFGRKVTMQFFWTRSFHQ